MTQYHPAANLFPMLPEHELAELAEDIRVNGQLEPIVLCEGKVLDGRNRERACYLLKIQPQYEDWEDLGLDVSPTAYVISKNLRRRHLSPSEAAAVAVQAEPIFAEEARQRQSAAGGSHRAKESKDERPLKANLPEALTSKGQARDKAAEVVGVSPRLVSDAKRIKAEAPEKFEEIKRGEKTVNRALKEMQDDEKNKIQKTAVGLRIASKVIAQLRKIPRDDAERKAGFVYLRHWIEENE